MHGMRNRKPTFSVKNYPDRLHEQCYISYWLQATSVSRNYSHITEQMRYQVHHMGKKSNRNPFERVELLATWAVSYNARVMWELQLLLCVTLFVFVSLLCFRNINTCVQRNLCATANQLILQMPCSGSNLSIIQHKCKWFVLNNTHDTVVGDWLNIHDAVFETCAVLNMRFVFDSSKHFRSTWHDMIFRSHPNGLPMHVMGLIASLVPIKSLLGSNWISTISTCLPRTYPVRKVSADLKYIIRNYLIKPFIYLLPTTFAFRVIFIG